MTDELLRSKLRTIEHLALLATGHDKATAEWGPRGDDLVLTVRTETPCVSDRFALSGPSAKSHAIADAMIRDLVVKAAARVKTIEAAVRASGAIASNTVITVS